MFEQMKDDGRSSTIPVLSYNTHRQMSEGRKRDEGNILFTMSQLPSSPTQLLGSFVDRMCKYQYLYACLTSLYLHYGVGIQWDTKLGVAVLWSCKVCCHGYHTTNTYTHARTRTHAHARAHAHTHAHTHTHTHTHTCTHIHTHTHAHRHNTYTHKWTH